MKTTRTMMALGALLTGCGGSDDHSPDAPPPTPDAPTFAGGAAIPLTSPDGSFYTASLVINSVGYALDIDTGSSSTGIAGTACTGCPVHPLYAPSPTAVDTHMTAQTQYADGSGWSGEIITDKAGLANATPDVNLSLVAINQQMGGFFADNSYQGIFGLGPKELLETGTTSYFDAATAAGLAPIMGFEMCDTSGTMWVGGFDASAAASTPVFTPLLPITGQSNPFYAVNVTDMGLGGTSLGFGSTTFQNPIVDTGTTIFYIPTAVDTALLAAINNSAGFKALFPGKTLDDTNCAQGATTVTAAMVDAMLPPMSMSFAGMAGGAPVTVSVPAMSSYLYGGNPGEVCFAFADGGSGNQYFGVMGDTIMRAFVTVIDLQNQRVGFAPDAGCHGHQALAQVPVHGGGRPREHGHPRRHAR